MPNRSFWKGRRVFLTGHTGFKGSWLALWLHSLGAQVAGYALDPPTQPNLFEQARVADHVHTIRGDIRDFAQLKAEIDKCRPEVILHLAAQSVVKRGYDDPIETYSSNVMGTVHLFEAVRQLKRPVVIVNVTSDKCYENREWLWGYRESEPMGGRDPYSNSKGCAELVTSSYRESFFPPEEIKIHGVALGSARAGNAIGGGDWTSNQLIPDLVRAFLSSQPCLIRNPLGIRPWQFVLEPLRGYLMLAEHLSGNGFEFASGWNFAPSDDDAKPVSWIADEMVRLWGDRAQWTRDAAVHPHEAHFLKLDASRSKAELGWRPLLPLAQALTWIVEWYRTCQSKGDLHQFTLMQIERYQDLCAREANAQAKASSGGRTLAAGE
jgi:CDP-glucose 4,6-dehydratase